MHTYVNSVGQAFQESPGKYLDGTNPTLMSFTTSWLNLAGLEGYERAYFFYLIGVYLSPHKLNLQIAYDYNPAPFQQTIIMPSNFNPNYGLDSVTITTTAVFTAGVNIIAVTDSSHLITGMPVVDATTDTNIPIGTTIVSVNYSTNEVLLNNFTTGASAISSGDTLNFPTGYNYGNETPYGGVASLEQWKIYLTVQRCQAFQITLSEIYDPSFGIIAGAGFTLSGLNMIVGLKKRFTPTKFTQQAGSS